MLRIVCINAGNYLGRGVEYVNILHDSIGRNISDQTPYKFICFTDSPGNYDPEIDVQPLPVEGLKGWWNKLALFKDGVFPDGDRIVYFDLDTAIVGSLDDIIKYNSEFAILKDFYRPGGLQSSMMMWCAGSKAVRFWDKFNSWGRVEIEGGDQAMIEDILDGDQLFQEDLLQDLYPQCFVSYKVHSRSMFPSGAKVVVFHGLPRPHEVISGWVPEVWKIGGGTTLELEMIGNVEEKQLIENIQHSLAQQYDLLVAADEHDGHAVIVAGGPSMADQIEDIKMRAAHGQKIFSMNGSHKFLADNGIVADCHVMIDARPENEQFVPVGMHCFYASQVHPSVFEKAKAKGNYITLWHSYADGIQEITESDPRETSFVGGGSSVGLKAIIIAYLLGFRTLHLYGFDSSYRDEQNHAYPQPLNDNEKTMEVKFNGQSYKVAPWMATQVEEFKAIAPQLISMGCTITMRGTGLLPQVFEQLANSVPAYEMRCDAIMKYIGDMESPIGAEIGVFTGALSAALLRKKPDLKLVMVDSWDISPEDSEYAKSDDFHAGLTKAQQDDYYLVAQQVTEFAADRAEIFRNKSIDAAALINDGSLDFVFIDADHSYDGASSDIIAWLPKVMKGGYLCGHDYENTEFPKFGVRRAVDEFIASSGLKLELGDNYTWFAQVI